MAGASVLVTLLFIEFGYRTFIKKKDATDKVHPFSFYVADSLLGYKYNQPALYKVLNSFPNGDTVYNTAYTTQSLPYLFGAAADISTVNMACIGKHTIKFINRRA